MSIRTVHAAGDDWANRRYLQSEPGRYSPPEHMVAPHSRNQQEPDLAPAIEEEEDFNDSDIDKDIDLLKAKEKDLRKRNII